MNKAGLHIINIVSFVLLAATLFVSCDDEYPEGGILSDMPRHFVIGSEFAGGVNFPPGAQERTITLDVKNIDWYADCSAGWLTVVKQDEKSLRIGVTEISGTERTATITFKRSDTGSELGSLQVVQKEYFFTIESGTREFPATASSGEVKISTNHVWSAASDASWVAVEKVSDALLKITVQENTGEDERRATVAFKRSDTGSEIASLQIVQEAPFGSGRTFTVNGVSFNMISVHGGTFQMGATSEQSITYSDEKPVHSVTLSDYYIGETEVTQELWQAVMGSNPSYYSGDPLCPVECVSWNDCQTFIQKLNVLTGENFKLPTEAQWEYAARGGRNSKGYQYSGSNTIGDVAWYTSNSGSKTHPVKSKSPNELGLYDMSGNVREWCSDWYSSGYYSSSPSNDPTGPSSGSGRVLRGGSWYNNAEFCRVASRNIGYPGGRYSHDGLRLAL